MKSKIEFGNNHRQIFSSLYCTANFGLPENVMQTLFVRIHDIIAAWHKDATNFVQKRFWVLTAPGVAANLGVVGPLDYTYRQSLTDAIVIQESTSHISHPRVVVASSSCVKFGLLSHYNRDIVSNVSWLVGPFLNFQSHFLQRNSRLFPLGTSRTWEIKKKEIEPI